MGRRTLIEIVEMYRTKLLNPREFAAAVLFLNKLHSQRK